MAGATNEQLEIGHVLFIDIVGYSKLVIEDQKERLRRLTAIVLATKQVREATNEQLVRGAHTPRVAIPGVSPVRRRSYSSPS